MVDAPSLPARALTRSRLGFGLTTVALVGLASTGTGLLVAHGTRQLEPPPPQALPAPPRVQPTPPVVVDRAPGTLRRPPAQPPRPPQVVVVVPARTVTVVPPAPVVPVVPEPVAPEPPVVEPPVVEPPVVEPPVVEPPVVEPDRGPTMSPHGHQGHTNHGKHLGQLKHPR